MIAEAPGTREVRGVPVTYCAAGSAPRYGDPIRLALDLRRLWRDHGPFDLLHLHGVWTAPPLVGVLAASRRGIPTVLCPHGCLDPVALAHRAWKKRLYLATLGRRVLDRVDGFQVHTERERLELPSDLRDRFTATVPVIVDSPRLESNDTLSPDGAGPLRLAMIGRIHPIKGFDRLIPILAEARRSELPFTLTVVGPDEGHREEVERSLGRRGLTERVSFTGLVDHDRLAKILEATDLVLVPSYQESFGLQAAEALLGARPVLVSPEVGVADLVADAGAGWVRPVEVGLWVDTLTIAHRDRAGLAEMGGRGRSMVRDRFGPGPVAKGMIAVYEEVMAMRSAATPGGTP